MPSYINIVNNMNKTQSRERSEVLADQLSEKIIQGKLEAGEKLNEADIALKFNVSRGPVREALRRLSERQLVVFSPNAGAKVKHHALEDMLNLLEVRLSLEVSAVQSAAKRMSTDEKSVLNNLFKRHSREMEANDPDVYALTTEDLDFHYVIAKHSGNPVLFKILCDDLYPRLRICRRQHQYVSGRATQALEEHRRILRAIEECDDELAGILMRRHLTAAKESLKRGMKKTESDLKQSSLKKKKSKLK